MSLPTTTDPQLRGIPPLAEGLYFISLYWMDGPNVAAAKAYEKSEVRQPPCLGWSSAWLLDRGVDERGKPTKMVTLFCPYTFDMFQITRHCFEYGSIRHPDWARPKKEDTPLDFWDKLLPRLKETLQRNWDSNSKYGGNKDFDTAATIMRLLGMEVPMFARPEHLEQKASGGKEADVLGLLKPVKRSGRKGQILDFFWPNTKSVREAMSAFSITRSNVLSQLYLLQKDNGIGYELKGDAAIIIMPAGCDNPWAEEKETT